MVCDANARWVWTFLAPSRVRWSLYCCSSTGLSAWARVENATAAAMIAADVLMIFMAVAFLLRFDTG